MPVWAQESFEGGADGAQVTTSTTSAAVIGGLDQPGLTHSTTYKYAGSKSAVWEPYSPTVYGLGNVFVQYRDPTFAVSFMSSRISVKFAPQPGDGPLEGVASVIQRSGWADTLFAYGPRVFMIGQSSSLRLFPYSWPAGSVAMSFASPGDLVGPFVPVRGTGNTKWYTFDCEVENIAPYTYRATGRLYLDGVLVSTRTVTTVVSSSSYPSTFVTGVNGRKLEIGCTGPSLQTFCPYWIDGLYASNEPLPPLLPPGGDLTTVADWGVDRVAW